MPTVVWRPGAVVVRVVLPEGGVVSASMYRSIA